MKREDVAQAVEGIGALISVVAGAGLVLGIIVGGFYVIIRFVHWSWVHAM